MHCLSLSKLDIPVVYCMMLTFIVLIITASVYMAAQLVSSTTKAIAPPNKGLAQIDLSCVDVPVNVNQSTNLVKCLIYSTKLILNCLCNMNVAVLV
jgi:hypothetical protein